MIWVIFALLTGAAVFAVLWPLSRAPAETDPRELDVAFYKAQTAEIERDSARGLLERGEADVARTEAARRLMAASRRADVTVARRSPWFVRLAAVAAMVFIPALALPLYWQIGAPGMADEPLQARLDAPPAQLDLATAIAKIERHLVKEPDDGRGWAVLGPIYARLQRYDDAQRAYSNVIRLLGPTPDRWAALGEAQTFAAGGTVTGDAKSSFEAAMKMDPKSARAGFYLGLAAEQDGDKPKAVSIWRTVVSNSPPDAPWLPTVNNHIAEATGASVPPPGAQAGAAGPAGPQSRTAASIAAMAPDQQQAMIQRMVAGLADRLKVNGNDLEGWLRLVRAYRVLKQDEKAKVALTDARHTFASDPEATKRLDALAHELGLEG